MVSGRFSHRLVNRYCPSYLKMEFSFHRLAAETDGVVSVVSKSPMAHPILRIRNGRLFLNLIGFIAFTYPVRFGSNLI